ncbi:rSAM-modified peptide [Parabacteroides sp. 52]|uniref:TIGR04149 family rSAM-modified RiPP n=1 Tax=unclassified Parabacteroides TaxID=2649774 RepID=UPI0013D5FC82|nr:MULTISPECIES: TIGR04149 family rSAM-modified RiPP [unclassified Parabacteroides]MDH6533768.1 natural product precursor [Parabacteroides sp. PM5-20]NDV54518.1 rSAM-modified peptide [Parabacteroides sp. 52]
MKKLEKMTLQKKAEVLNEQEMKMVVGGYDSTDSCSGPDGEGKCNGSCLPHPMGGGSRNCEKDVTHVTGKPSIAICMCK